MKTKKELMIVAGPNGSGKTTFAKKFLAKYSDFVYLSADEIAFSMVEKDFEKVKIKAGKEFFRRLEKIKKLEQNVLIESTLSGKTLLKSIKKFKEKGYETSIVFIFVEKPSVSIERIRERVLKGGHNVPDEDVIRRFSRSKNNFWSIYKNLVENWFLVFNSEGEFYEFALGEKEDFILTNRDYYLKFKESLDKNAG